MRPLVAFMLMENKFLTIKIDISRSIAPKNSHNNLLHTVWVAATTWVSGT